MKGKYWVLAIERANLVLKEVSLHPEQFRLIDLSRKLEINKSSLYSLLHTLEHLGWIVKSSEATYSLGPTLGSISSMYLSQFNIVQSFYKEARSEEHTSELQSRFDLVCRLLLEKKNNI